MGSDPGPGHPGQARFLFAGRADPDVELPVSVVVGVAAVHDGRADLVRRGLEEQLRHDEIDIAVALGDRA